MGIGVVGVEGTGREGIEPGPGAGRGTEAVAAAAGLVEEERIIKSSNNYKMM